MENNLLLKYLCCPKCKSDLIRRDNFLICKKCGSKYEISDGVVKIIPDITPDLELSIQKWDEFYQKQLKNKSYIR